MDILKKVQDLDSSDKEAYVIAMPIQKELKDIDIQADHNKTKTSALMNRLLENMSENQTKNKVLQNGKLGRPKRNN